MTTEKTLSAVAGEAYQWFESRSRDNGEESFVTLKNGRPEWLHHLVMEAHGDFLPDDWRYESIRSALGTITDSGAESEEDLDDIGMEWADDNVDVYNGARTAWLASNLTRGAYCDDALDEFGPETIRASMGVFHLIGMGQYMESREIWSLVVRQLVDYVSSLEQDEGE